jgi:hypothetical protein
MAALLIGCLAIQLAWPLAILPFHLSWDYGEGWNAYWADRAMSGAPLYTGAGSAITNNYPPLSFYIFGAAGRLMGDTIIAGRLLSLLGLGLCAGGIAAAVRRLGGTGGWALASAAAFLTYVASFSWRYVGSDDPQWLAAAFTVGALLLLVWERGFSAVRIAGAAALLVIGGLIKHNQLAAPIAVTLWLAIADRRGLLVWLAAGSALAAATLTLLYAGFGSLLFDQVLHHHRLFKARYLFNALSTMSGLLPEICVAVMIARRAWGDRHDRRLLLMLLFATVATLLGIGERLGTGVSTNAHFDSMIGLIAVAGVALGRSDRLDARRRPLMAAFCLLPLVSATLGTLPSTVDRFAGLADARTRWADAISLIRATPGPVACELPALCYWAGKPFTVDFYNYGQKLRTIGDPSLFGRAIARQDFQLMAVVRDGRFRVHDGRLPDAYNRLIERAYRPFFLLSDQAVLLRPRAGV